MTCLYCKKEELQYSAPITYREQRTYNLMDTERFAFCPGCGCVMLEKSGKLHSSDGIKNLAIISFAQRKLFMDKAKKPTHYGLTANKDSAEKMPTEVEEPHYEPSSTEVLDILIHEAPQAPEPVKQVIEAGSKQETSMTDKKLSLWSKFTSFIAGIFKPKAS